MSYPIILKCKSKEIRLEEHDLPAPPLTFNMDTIMSKRNYPGNPDPTVQVLGFKFGEIEFQGTFKDWRNRTDGYAESMKQELLDFQSKAEETTMQYASQVFIGIMEGLTFSTHNIHEIDYKIKFSVSRTDLKKVNKIVMTNRVYAGSLVAKATGLKAAVEAVSNLSTSIQELHTNIQLTINSIKEKAGFNDVNDIISDVNDILINIKRIHTDIRDIKSSSFLDMQGLNNIQYNLRNLRNEALTIHNSYDIDSKNILYVVGQGDTIYSIASKYNTTWQDIANKNNLSTLDLVMGQKLVIPI